MKIVVLLHCPRTGPDLETPLPGLAPADRAALRLGARLARGDDSELIAVNIGPPAEEPVLHRALALGAKRTVRIWSSHSVTDNLWAISRLGACGLRELGFDVILAGDRSVNWSSGMTGPALAHQLDIPHASSVVGASVNQDPNSGRKLRIERLHGSTAQSLELPLPALLTTRAVALEVERAEADESRPQIEQKQVEQLDLTDRTPTAPVALFALNVEQPPMDVELVTEPAALLARLRALRLLGE